MGNNGIKIGPRSGTRLVATEVPKGLRVPKRGQGEIKGQKGNPKQKGDKENGVPTGPGARTRGRRATLRLHGRSPEAEQRLRVGAESVGSWGTEGYGMGPEGEGRSGQGLVRTGVGSG